MNYLIAWFVTGVLAFAGVMMFSKRRRAMILGFPWLHRMVFAGISVLVWPVVLVFAFKGEESAK